MAKKTSEEILEGMKKATEKATDMIGDAAAVVADAAKPVVSKAKKAAAPTVKKAVKAGSDAAQAVVETTKKVTPKKPEYYVQFVGKEIDMEDLANQAKASFKEEHKRTAVMSCRVYLKPEDSAAYYVINDTYFGRIDL